MAETVSHITITGASGFLGHWLVNAAQAGGVSARAISRNGAAHASALLVRNYAETPAPRIEGEVLVHLAQANRMDTTPDHLGAVALTERLSRLGYRHILYASSAAVYGDQSAQPHRPDESLTAQTDYAALKLACEKPILSAGGAVMRLTNLYGPGQSQATVIARLLSQIPGTAPLRLRTLTPVRDFCWVGDAARAILALAEVKASGIFNVGQGKSLSIGDLAHAALNAAGESGRRIEAEITDTAFSALSVDISKTSEACGWVPCTTLKDGLKRTIEAVR